MRIISGKKRGKKIFLPHKEITRPLRDYVKENIFNIIIHNKSIKIDLRDKIILDVFSGSGSFGIECLSRDAKYVFFIEENKKIIPILKKNLLDFDKEKKYVVEKDFFNLSLESLKDLYPDIIFFDPPYKILNPERIFEKILDIKNRLKNTIFIFHTFKNNKIKFPNEFEILIVKKYGISVIFFLKLKN